jgi:hypothetical protein
MSKSVFLKVSSASHIPKSLITLSRIGFREAASRLCGPLEAAGLRWSLVDEVRDRLVEFEYDLIRENVREPPASYGEGKALKTPMLADRFAPWAVLVLSVLWLCSCWCMCLGVSRS